MKHILAISAVGLALLTANNLAAADNPALEKKDITIAVGGSISQMNKVDRKSTRLNSSHRR